MLGVFDLLYPLMAEDRNRFILCHRAINKSLFYGLTIEQVQPKMQGTSKECCLVLSRLLRKKCQSSSN